MVKSLKDQRGFSLQELLIVMGITAVLATIGIPSYLSTRHRYTIDGETEKLIAHIREGVDRARSRQGGSAWGFGFNNGAQDWYELLEGGVSGTSTNRVYLNSGVEFTSTTTSVTFSGGPSVNILGSNLTIGLQTTNGQFTDTITVDTFGRVSRTSNYDN